MADYKVLDYASELTVIADPRPADGDTLINETGSVLTLCFGAVDATGDVFQVAIAGGHKLPALNPGETHTFDFAVDGPGYVVVDKLFALNLEGSLSTIPSTVTDLV